MNKEYMIIDDTVIVEDENREKRIMENSSNLEKNINTRKQRRDY